MTRTTWSRSAAAWWATWRASAPPSTSAGCRSCRSATLVAQVDSAYGGKTGVDLPEGKNYVGAYHQPAAVLADPDALDPAGRGARGRLGRGGQDGADRGRRAVGAVRGGAPVDRDLVLACARVKLRIVAQDERDAGRRQTLNLGHTVGHAIETATGYARYRHGEAVGLGLLAALALSGQPELREEVAELLAARGLPAGSTAVDPTRWPPPPPRDKKRRGGRVRLRAGRGAGRRAPAAAWRRATCEPRSRS